MTILQPKFRISSAGITVQQFVIHNTIKSADQYLNKNRTSRTMGKKYSLPMLILWYVLLNCMNSNCILLSIKIIFDHMHSEDGFLLNVFLISQHIH